MSRPKKWQPFKKDGIVYANGADPEEFYEVDGEEYYVTGPKLSFEDWVFYDNRRRIADYDGDPLHWSRIITSYVKDMDMLFFEKEEFNQDISNWDVSNVINMSAMFAYAESFNQDISGWDTGRVQNFNSMFAFAHSFCQDLSGWDASRHFHDGSYFAQHSEDYEDKTKLYPPIVRGYPMRPKE